MELPAVVTLEPPAAKEPDSLQHSHDETTQNEALAAELTSKIFELQSKVCAHGEYQARLMISLTKTTNFVDVRSLANMEMSRKTKASQKHARTPRRRSCR